MSKHSLWELESFYAPKSVIIIGSGLGGLWSAYYLKKLRPGWEIALVDKGLVPSGASTRNAGFASFGSLTELVYDARMLGIEKMLGLVHMRFRGLRKIRKMFPDHLIDFRRYGGFELISAGQYGSLQQLQHDIEWINGCLRQVTRTKHVFRISDKKISVFGFENTAHLVENKLEAQLHSGKLVQQLLQKVLSLGVSLLPGMEVKGFEQSGDGFLVHTEPGAPLFARKLLVCTNAMAGQLLPGLDLQPARGQILVTSPVQNLPFRGTFHADEGFYYFRNLGKRVLLGGARNKAFEAEQTFDPSLSDTIQQELERYLREVILPGRSFSVEHRWSGIMGMGSSKFPTVKQVSPGCFCATGMGGMGVAFSPVVGKRVAQMMVEASA